MPALGYSAATVAAHTPSGAADCASAARIAPTAVTATTTAPAAASNHRHRGVETAEWAA